MEIVLFLIDKNRTPCFVSKNSWCD